MTKTLIEHASTSYFLPLREDYLRICHGNHCQALILAVLEQWSNAKGETYVTMTYPQWVMALYQLYGRHTIIKALADLIQMGYIQRQTRLIRGKQTFAYLLNVKRINTLLKQSTFMDERVLKHTHRKVNSKEPSTVQKYMVDASKSERFIESLPQITESTDTEEANAVELTINQTISSAAHHDHLFFSPIDKPTKEEQGSQYTSLGDFSHSTCVTFEQASNEATQEQEEQPDVITPHRPADGVCSAENIVQLIEYKRGQRYPQPMRGRQLQAAMVILSRLPHLSISQLEEAYDHNLDAWWRDRYGHDCHVTHLATISPSEYRSGQQRLRLEVILDHLHRSRHSPTSPAGRSHTTQQKGATRAVPAAQKPKPLTAQQRTRLEEIKAQLAAKSQAIHTSSAEGALHHAI